MNIREVKVSILSFIKKPLLFTAKVMRTKGIQNYTSIERRTTTAPGRLPSYISCRSYYYEPNEEVHIVPFFFCKYTSCSANLQGEIPISVGNYPKKGAAGLADGHPLSKKNIIIKITATWPRPRYHPLRLWYCTRAPACSR